jgi:hypothetical protein
VPRSRVYQLWQAYVEITEVFSLSLSEFQQILNKSLFTYFNISEELFDEETAVLFDMFDTDKVERHFLFQLSP